MNEPTLTVIPIPYQPSWIYFSRLRVWSYAAWLDSSAKPASYSDSQIDILTAAPEVVLACREGQVYKNGQLYTVDGVVSHAESLTQSPSPFSVMREIAANYDVAEEDIPEGIPFSGGWLGWWGYDLKAAIEPRRFSSKPTQTDMVVGLYLWAIVLDHRQQRGFVVVHKACQLSQAEILARLFSQTNRSLEPFRLQVQFSSATSPDQYQQQFNAIQNYIRQGDCYQVNLTQRFSATYSGDVADAYLALREVSPAPFSAWLDFPDIAILSISPERFIRIQAREVETKPIKGTRPRHADPLLDQQFADELRRSHKDQAENVMIVDLLRNDLSKHCRQVRVPELFALERFANVHHLVSTVTATLKHDADCYHILEDSFPGGSITGAPKVRAMEIIDELESVSRQAYCGCIGYISLDGSMDTNIAIRTLVAEKNQLHCWGGGGIVADSDADAEYQESITKVHNLLTCLHTFQAK
ncbi:aminodeoxychorismate synthase component I [Zooshikella harenae]|uniref:aminodeoxychorismate synthase n=1 Tax=Zooshikella harenae TaxID=2827238 RepID=A0ABS5Z9S6_9GAMM|nr:aminodeoxychorismate synthase component I [Zooshikella harenae]MBU2710740.1 aminodeoxychorismate synthase component I [Zooshikella harenae]